MLLIECDKIVDYYIYSNRNNIALGHRRLLYR